MTNKEAIEELRNIKKEIDDVFIFTGDKKTEALDLAIKALEERPQGEWIFRSGGYYKCSNCGEVERAKKNYCSNCGADTRHK